MESFCFDALIVCDDGAIGEDAIDVEYDEFNMFEVWHMFILLEKEGRCCDLFF